MNKDNIDNELEEIEAELQKEEDLKEKEILNKPDFYPDLIEDKYHNFDKMNSLGVLEKEKLMCYKIIRYKKKINKDCFIWEKKKKDIDKRIKSITSLIENQTWTLTVYRSKIKEEYEGENYLLTLVDNEYGLTKEQKEIIKDRINDRKSIIENELNQKVEEENNIEEPEKDLVELEKELIQINGNIDLYPSTVEDIYHNVGKIISLGVLEKEKELCDRIIEYKKGKIMEFNIWETKKENIDKTIKSITSLVENGTWDLDEYKKKIKEEQDWEKKLLDLSGNDSSLDDAQKRIIKARIKERIKLIQGELDKNPEEE